MLNPPGYQLKWVRSPHSLVVYNVASSVRGPGYDSRCSRRDVTAASMTTAVTHFMGLAPSPPVTDTGRVSAKLKKGLS